MKLKSYTSYNINAYGLYTFPIFFNSIETKNGISVEMGPNIVTGYYWNKEFQMVTLFCIFRSLCELF